MTEKDHESGEIESRNSRRDFMRKASYTAPALVVLGVAAHSPMAKAQLASNPPPPGSKLSEDEVLLEELQSEGKPNSG